VTGRDACRLGPAERLLTRTNGDTKGWEGPWGTGDG
jgi:hypothetical protein